MRVKNSQNLTHCFFFLVEGWCLVAFAHSYLFLFIQATSLHKLATRSCISFHLLLPRWHRSQREGKRTARWSVDKELSQLGLATACLSSKFRIIRQRTSQLPTHPNRTIRQTIPTTRASGLHGFLLYLPRFPLLLDLIFVLPRRRILLESRACLVHEIL